MKRYTAPPVSPPRVYLGYIPKGFRGTVRTVEHMKALIRAGVKDFYVRQKAIDILMDEGITPKDYLGEIRAVFEWVQRNVRYTRDPFRLELLHSARRMLELRAGDCDDLAILLGAMLESVGHPVRLVLTGPNPRRPRLFTHVYVEAYHQGRWIPLDPTMPHPMGWAPSTPVRHTIAIDRSPAMTSRSDVPDMIGAAGEAPDWLRSLLRAVRTEAVTPKDARVKSLWDLLRQQGLLSRSAWLKRVLRRIWDNGLAARPRPRTTRAMVRLLRAWAILPPRPVVPTGSSVSISVQPGAPVRLTPMRPVIVRPWRPWRRPWPPRRPITMRSLRPVMVRPVARPIGRR
jgi:hypothetical protein